MKHQKMMVMFHSLKMTISEFDMICDKNDPSTINVLVKVLKKGGTCVLPCDTIYGLSAIMGIGEKPLKELKGRDASKPFLVLATLDMAKQMCTEIPEEILNAWPASLTAILNTKDANTTGIRVPDDQFLQTLIKKLGTPIYSTSVNISGEPSLLDFKSICEKFGSKVDVLVKGNEIQGTTASTLIDATQRPFKILRQGAYTLK